MNGELQDYIESMEKIFSKGLESGAEVIFMTPGMLNTSVAEDTQQKYYEYAFETAKMQNEGNHYIPSCQSYKSFYKRNARALCSKFI